MNQDIVSEFSDFALNFTYKAVPKNVVDYSKKLLLYYVGDMLACSTTRMGKTLFEIIDGLGGVEEATAIGYHRKTSCLNAAFANGFMARALELNDTYNTRSIMDGKLLPFFIHVGDTIIPACLAVSESKGVSGETFLETMVLGYETTIRISSAFPTTYINGFDNTIFYGSIGSAIVASKLHNLDKKRLVNALGLAGTNNPSGIGPTLLIQDDYEGDVSKNFGVGAAAMAGIFAAMSAQHGLTGSKRILDGFCKAVAQNKCDLEKVTAGLGETFEMLKASMKPYPSVRIAHAPIEATLAIKQKYGIRPEETQKIIVGSPGRVVTKRNIKVTLQAQFSIPYAVATALIYGDVWLEHYIGEKFGDERVLEFMDKVEVVVDEEIIKQAPHKWPGYVKIITKDGKEYFHQVVHTKGDPENPMTDEEIEQKFRRMALLAVDEARAQEIIKMVKKLEEVDDMRDFGNLLRKSL